MKKFFSILFCLSLSISLFAQGSDVIIKQIPKTFKINDNVYLVNKSPYHILHAIVAKVENGQYTPLGSATGLAPNDNIEIAAFSDNKLKKLRGSSLAIKVKALKKPIEQITDLDNVDPEDLTYNFDVILSENRHDLIIEVIMKRASGDIMDF